MSLAVGSMLRFPGTLVCPSCCRIALQVANVQRNAENSTLTTAVQLATTTAASLVNTTISVNYTTQFSAIQASYAANTTNTVSQECCSSGHLPVASAAAQPPAQQLLCCKSTLHSHAPCLCAAVDILPAGEPDPELGDLHPSRVRLRIPELQHLWSQHPHCTQHWR